jgi:hypothetical protein
MTLVLERRSEQAPPPHVVFDSLVDEIGTWWVSVEGEREPRVRSAVTPETVTFASPFIWRPDDVVEIVLTPVRAGCEIHLRQTGDEPSAPMEAAILRHRWGEHIDRDLRERFDCGGRPDDYSVSL